MYSLIRKIFILSIVLLSVVGYGFFVFAAAPSGGYEFAQTLDPDCAPNDTDCFVKGYYVNTTTNASWVGYLAGSNGASTNNTVFVGINAGDGATNADNSNFIGPNAGQGATDAYQSNFFGPSAGCYATNANDSNFFGFEAGCYATNANNSNFFGNRAGFTATNAAHATFFGDNSGNLATNAYSSAFVGANAGENATNAYQSNFFGLQAGQNATGANDANFFGYQAGKSATNAASSVFIGNSAGLSATLASGANFIGYQAGYQSAGGVASNFIGYQAGYVSSAASSNFSGYQAGYEATSANSSNFSGYQAGYQASSANNSNFIGYQAGFQATSAAISQFIGNYAGYGATTASSSVFLGHYSGREAINAHNSFFIGNQSGWLAEQAYQSNFFGNGAGKFATNAYYSQFYGTSAGQGAPNANNSIFIGYEAGYGDTVDNSLGGTSILIGDQTSTGGFSNSIALGAGAVNDASNQFMIGSAASPIDFVRINGSLGTQCTITVGTGLACTSDERLKTNIVDLSNVLDSLLKVRTVTYNWLQNPNSQEQVGFLAQDLEQYFPDLVATDKAGMKSVYYSQITPILVEAIRELNIKMDSIQGASGVILDTHPSLISWFANAANGIKDFVVDTLRARRGIFTDQLCVGAVCVTQDQFLQMVQQAGMTPVFDEGASSGDEVDSGTTSSVTGTATSTDELLEEDTQIPEEGVQESSSSTVDGEELITPELEIESIDGDTQPEESIDEQQVEDVVLEE